MDHILKGLHHFRNGIFEHQKELYTELVAGQNPRVLFISCSDSRVMPAMMTQSGPGDLFELRNAGNLVPPYGASTGGEAATIEFALAALDVQDVVVCGHTHCGAMKALLDPSQAEKMPLVKSWLNHAETTRRIMVENYPHLAPEHRANVAVQENVLVQIENLQTHPAVAVKLQRGEINLHAWVYRLETGEVFSYDDSEGFFKPLVVPTPTGKNPSAASRA
jgi:carbonic anhydrase